MGSTGPHDGWIIKTVKLLKGSGLPASVIIREPFNIINTFVSEGREAQRDNYVITAKDPSGPWSDPVIVEGADGIDSSLFFDDDGLPVVCGKLYQPGMSVRRPSRHLSE